MSRPVAIVLTPFEQALLIRILRERVEREDEPLAADILQMLENALDAGAGAIDAFAYGMLPLALPQWIAYGLYRWEMNIRMAAVLGFVGAGGLGQQMEMSMKMFNGSEVSTMLIAFILMVWLADYVSMRLRKVIA